jgi:acetyltransferase-like isoleucine patch superfamily enzyme
VSRFRGGRAEGDGGGLLHRILPLLYPSLSDRVRYQTYRRIYEIDPDFRFNGDNIVLLGAGRIVLGAGSYVGSGSILSAVPGQSITVGVGVKVASRVAIYTNSLRVGKLLDGVEEDKMGDVSIGDGAWICLGAYIGPGVTIQPNGVVPAYSVVTKSP